MYNWLVIQIPVMLVWGFCICHYIYSTSLNSKILAIQLPANAPSLCRASSTNRSSHTLLGTALLALAPNTKTSTMQAQAQKTLSLNDGVIKLLV